jgi:hydrogenase expression/formation protein HypE
MQLPLLPAGKLPPARLRALIETLPAKDPAVLVGPRVGEDAAVIDLGERCIVVTTDPITFAADRIGWYAVHVNANDVAVMGARPRWFFAVLLLPPGGPGPEQIMADIVNTSASLGITVCGGHTEITPGLDRPIVVGQMIGEVERSRLVTKRSLQPGDYLVMTRGVAIEGTAILAREAESALRGRVSSALIERAARFLEEPGITVVEAAMAAASIRGVKAMHDPTEGGILAGLAEMASASNTGLHVDGDAIPVFRETAAICKAFGVDPLGLIASGALLIGVAERALEELVSSLTKCGIPSAVIGRAVPLASGTSITLGGTTIPLVPPERDEIARVLYGNGPSGSSTG